jgi:hypothetical protein
MQLEVVWNLLLQAGSEGPTLISRAASWRTNRHSSLTQKKTVSDLHI